MTSKTIFFNQCFDKDRLKALISWCFLKFGENKTLELLEKLKEFGFHLATQGGISLSIDDLKIPASKSWLISQADVEIDIAQRHWKSGNLTAVEEFQQMIDTWHRTSETLRQDVVRNFRTQEILNPLSMMAFSGARGNISQVRQLVGMRGLMSDPQGQIIDFPIRSNFREGLTLIEYVISCYGARKGVVDTALRTANSGYLTRRLVDVAHHVVVGQFDCGTRRGLLLLQLGQREKSLSSFEDRLVGRVLAEKIDLLNGEIIQRNQDVSHSLATKIAISRKQVLVRSPLTCEAKQFICQLCYGWSLAHGNIVSLGEAVGILAAQSIGEPGTQLTMRTFHTGGVFSGDVMNEIRAPFAGTIFFPEPLQGKLIRTPHGKIAFLTKVDGIFVINFNKILSSNIKNVNAFKKSKTGISQFHIPSGTLVFVRQNQKVLERELLVEYPSVTAKSNQRVQSQHKLNSTQEGEIFFENVLLGIPKTNDSVTFARKLSCFWILSGKICSSPQITPTFPQNGDLVEKNALWSQWSLISPFNGFLNVSSNLSDLNSYSFLKYIPKKTPVFFSQSCLQISLNTIQYKKLGYLISYPAYTTENFLLSFSLQNNKQNIQSFNNLFSIRWFPQAFKIKPGRLLAPQEKFSELQEQQGQKSKDSFGISEKKLFSISHGFIFWIPEKAFCYARRDFILTTVLIKGKAANFSLNHQGFLKKFPSEEKSLIKIQTNFLTKTFTKNSSKNLKKTKSFTKKLLKNKSFKFQHLNGINKKLKIKFFKKNFLASFNNELKFSRKFLKNPCNNQENFYFDQLIEKTKQQHFFSIKKQNLLPLTEKLYRKLPTFQLSYQSIQICNFSLIRELRIREKLLQLNKINKFHVQLQTETKINLKQNSKNIFFGKQQLAKIRNSFITKKFQKATQFTSKSGWIYFPKSTFNLSKTHNCLISRGNRILDDIIFDQYSVYTEFFTLQSFSYEASNKFLPKSRSESLKNIGELSQRNIPTTKFFGPSNFFCFNTNHLWYNISDLLEQKNFSKLPDLVKKDFVNEKKLFISQKNFQSYRSSKKSFLNKKEKWTKKRKPIIQFVFNTKTQRIFDNYVGLTSKPSNSLLSFQSAKIPQSTFEEKNFETDISWNFKINLKKPLIFILKKEKKFVQKQKRMFSLGEFSFEKKLKISSLQKIETSFFWKSIKNSKQKGNVFVYGIFRQVSEYFLPNKNDLKNRFSQHYSKNFLNDSSVKHSLNDFSIYLPFFNKQTITVSWNAAKKNILPNLDFNLEFYFATHLFTKCLRHPTYFLSFVIYPSILKNYPFQSSVFRISKKNFFTTLNNKSEKKLNIANPIPVKKASVFLNLLKKNRESFLYPGNFNLEKFYSTKSSETCITTIKKFEKITQCLENITFSPLLECLVQKEVQLGKFSKIDSRVQNVNYLRDIKFLVYKFDIVIAHSPLVVESFLSPFTGEIITKRTSLGQKSLIVTNADQISFSTKKFLLNNKVIFSHLFVGEMIRLGEEIVNDIAINCSGQIIEIEKQKFVLRQAQPFLASSKSIFHVGHGEFVEKNAPLLTLFYQRLKTGDIVQGIPKIEELFEARQTKQGEVLENNVHQQLKKFFYISKVNLNTKEAVRVSFEKIRYVLVQEIQQVYQSQGVSISEKHIEIIVRQMTSKVRILDGGKTGLLPDEFVDLRWIEIVNDGIVFKKAEYEPIVLGITKAALEAGSFISAASFQETTRVLTRAAIERKTDFLRGLKENVILGRLIPAGTGFSLVFQPQKANFQFKNKKQLESF